MPIVGKNKKAESTVLRNMKPAATRFLKIGLEKTQFCGTCMHVQKYDVILDYGDALKLRASAQAVASAKPDGPAMRSEDVLTLLAVALKVSDRKIYCEKERTWTPLLEPACSLWQPRVRECTSESDDAV